MPTAIITGASRGLGLALARALAERSWNLVLDARGGEALQKVAEELSATTEVVAVTGDVADDDTGPSWWRRPGPWAVRTCW